MNDSFSLLEANLNDEDQAAEVLRLLDAFSGDSFGDGHPLSADVHAKVIGGLREFPTTRIYLAYEGTEAVGLAICFLSYSTFRARRILNIKDYFVPHMHRGRGIGRRLMGFVAERARAEDCCLLTLEVQENNERARAIYAAAGFEQATYVPEAGGALYLQKPL